MATSTFQNARAALKALIVSRLTTDGTTSVDVFEYRPMGNATREDMVWIDRIRVEQDVIAMGGTSRVVGETLTIDVAVRAPVAGADQQDAAAAEQRAELIWASVENAVRAGPTISGTVMHADIEAFEMIPDYDEQGAIGSIDATIILEANI